MTFKTNFRIKFSDKSIKDFGTTYPMLSALQDHPIQVEGEYLKDIGKNVKAYLDKAFADLTTQAARSISVEAFVSGDGETVQELPTPTRFSVLKTYLTLDDFYSNLILKTSSDVLEENPVEEASKKKATTKKKAPAKKKASPKKEAVVETPAEVVTEAPAEVVTEAPAEVVTEAPAEVVTETPAEVVTEAPAEVVTEAPAEVVTETPAEVVAEAPVAVVAEAPVEVVAEETVEVVAEAPVEVIAEAPAEVVAETTTITSTELPSEPTNPETAIDPSAIKVVEHSDPFKGQSVTQQNEPLMAGGLKLEDTVAQQTPTSPVSPTDLLQHALAAATQIQGYDHPAEAPSGIPQQPSTPVQPAQEYSTPNVPVMPPVPESFQAVEAPFSQVPNPPQQAVPSFEIPTGQPSPIANVEAEVPAPIVIEAPAQPVMEFAQPNYTRTENNNAVIDRIADILSKADSSQLEQTKTYLIKLLMEALLQPAPGLLLEPGEEYQRLVYDHASILGAFDYIIHG